MNTNTGAPDASHVERSRLDGVITGLFFLAGIAFAANLMHYYATGAGGPSLLAIQMVPASIVMLVLNDLRQKQFYPRLPRGAQAAIGLVYIGAAIAAAVYLYVEFNAIRITRLGIWNTWDFMAGGSVVLLVLEYTRRKYLPVFIVNLVLILYTLFGFLVPGMFHHPGLSFERMMSSLSLEMSTGVFERLPQLGLTLIGSFLLLLSALRAFGCIDSILQASSRLAARAPHLLPQAAVIGSFAVAAVSGSGAANAATTGTATIPMFVKANFPRAYAAAVETASSLGGQLMPPLMGISAFMMAEFLRVSYFDVVARGFAPAIIYFVAVALSVYLLALRYQTRSVGFELSPLSRVDQINLVSYLGAILALIYLMGVVRWPAMTAAQSVFLVLLGVLSAVFFVNLWRTGDWHPRTVARPFLRLVDVFAVTTSELVVLLSTLGILTASFTVTGVPDKVGILLMELADVHLVVMVLVAFLFGYLVGMGLPVTPTYIITAVVVTPFMIRAGVDPWVAHFFAFFVAVFGELSPPTSVTAAVTSRIAETSFMRTMMYALGLCLPLMVMMAGVFTRPGLVVEPGLAQIPDVLLILVACLGLAFCLQSRFAERRWLDIGVRVGLAALSLTALLHIKLFFAGLAAAPVLALVVYGFLRSRRAEPASA